MASSLPGDQVCVWSDWKVAQPDQMQTISRGPGRTWKASAWHPRSVWCPHIMQHPHATWQELWGPRPLYIPNHPDPKGDLVTARESVGQWGASALQPLPYCYLPTVLMGHILWERKGWIPQRLSSTSKWQRSQKDVTQSYCSDAGCSCWFRKMVWKLLGLKAAVNQH